MQDRAGESCQRKLCIWVRTITRGAIIQFTTKLKASCIQRGLVLKMRCNSSYCTLQRIGYIMTISPAAKIKIRSWKKDVPIGAETPMNVAASNTSWVSGTKQPNRIPSAIASRIHRGRKRSRKDSLPLPQNVICWWQRPGRDMLFVCVPAETRTPHREYGFSQLLGGKTLVLNNIEVWCQGKS